MKNFIIVVLIIVIVAAITATVVNKKNKAKTLATTIPSPPSVATVPIGKSDPYNEGYAAGLPDGQNDGRSGYYPQTLSDDGYYASDYVRGYNDGYSIGYNM